MLPGIVAIDVPQETPTEWVQAAAQACTAALGEGRCVLESDDTVVWHARVSVDATSPPTLRVELHAASDDAPASTRVLQFSDIDPERQRWASAGVVVAALVSAREAGGEPAEVEAPAPEPSSQKPATANVPPPAVVQPDLPKAPAPPQPAGRVWLDVAFAPRRGAEGGPLALGGLLNVSVRPLKGPWMVSVEGTAAWTSTPFEGRWLSLGVATGVRLFDTPAWEIALAVRAEQLRAALSRASGGDLERDEGTATHYGGGIESRLAVPLTAPLWAFVGAEATLYDVAIEVSEVGEVRTEDRLVGRAPTFGFGMDLGLRWVFLP